MEYIYLYIYIFGSLCGCVPCTCRWFPPEWICVDTSTRAGHGGEVKSSSVLIRPTALQLILFPSRALGAHPLNLITRPTVMEDNDPGPRTHNARGHRRRVHTLRERESTRGSVIALLPARRIIPQRYREHGGVGGCVYVCVKKRGGGGAHDVKEVKEGSPLLGKQGDTMGCEMRHLCLRQILPLIS